ncbi:RNA polymerase sigma factor [Tellurirhabdus bombi]|uniref:RNA polymerase sigma factor n=1 Tax=Tellurirhabdus bombi TaxID=2907205 RepID=UPI001F30B5EB|nr:sigma-70 family RNA polymerase sigma factor [Tellurirhabdus bombi]
MIRIIPFFITEAQLISALQRADARAQKVVYERYASRMLTVCARYIGDRFTAEEVLMDGFMRVFERIDQYKGEGSFEGWVRRIMVNEALTYLRRNKHWLAEVALDDALPTADVAFADQNIQAEDLLNLLEKLPEGYRTVFNLYAIEGYNHAEIAESLGISESTSKSQLHRARALLQKQLAHLDVKKNYLDYETASR